MIATTPATHLSPYPGRCGEPLEDERWSICGARCIEVVGTPPEGRVLVRAAFCDAHGGEPRARERVAKDWAMLAPASVGDDQAVIDAGTAALGSEHAYLVIREDSPRFTAALGVGSHTIQVPNPAGGRQRRRGGTTAEERASKPSFAFASREEAIQVGLAAWRASIDARVEEIRRARGGTLAWGAPVEPRPEPIVLFPNRGESAYDALARQEAKR